MHRAASKEDLSEVRQHIQQGVLKTRELRLQAAFQKSKTNDAPLDVRVDASRKENSSDP